MASYVWKNGTFVDKATGEEMVVPDGPVACPQVMPDTPGYASPIDGRWIEGRSARREDLIRNGCQEAGDRRRLNDGMARNEKFARRHGLKHVSDQ